jgi:dienelactone hydrolase
MNTHQLFQTAKSRNALLVLLGCLAVLVAAAVLASLTQRSFGRVAVSNVTYPNFNGILIRAKLFKPLIASKAHPVPGIVYIHGYQNNRETSDAYSIELARRGFAVLAIDAIGRGNSGVPKDLHAPDFDDTYGGRTSLEHLKSLPFVDAGAVGLMGHSVGASIVYRIALEDPTVKALVISGFAYKTNATAQRPKNMLMTFGRYDEYRNRMTGTRHFEAEWMRSELTRRVFGSDNPQAGKTYGNFADGTARRIIIPPITHLHESHSEMAVAEAIEWMRQALHPPPQYWIPANRQIWPIKEWSTLVAMLACLASLLPLGLLLLKTPFFRSLQGPVSGSYACSRGSYLRIAALNGLIMWLYLPLVFVLFGIHVYLVKIDRAFPMMMVNGIVWWFVWINIIGFVIFRFWFKKRSRQTGLTLADLGLSYQPDRFALDKVQIAKTALLAAILFAFAYLSEYILERILIVDFRFIFPFASDLTAYRAFMWVIYFPWLLLAFVLLGIFVHGQLCRPLKDKWWKTFISWSFSNTAALVIPLLTIIAVQYVPLYITGWIPFEGPGGMLVSFVLNLFHIIGVLIMVIPISTWFYQLTGKIYLGAVLNAALVTWMFVSSQVIAPIPV